MRYPQKTPEQFTLSTDMGVKIGDETLLAGDTVLSPGEQLSVASASKTESKAPLSMTAGNTQSAPPFNPEWLNDKNGIVNVGMVEALIDKAGGSKFDGDMSGKELKWESDYAVFLRITPNEMVLDRGNYLDVYRKDYGLDPVYPGTSNSYAPLRMYRDRDGGNYYEDQWLSDDRSVANVGMVKALMGEVDLSDISSSAVKIISGSSVIIQNDSYLGLEVTPQGESTLSGDTLTLKSRGLTKTLEELAVGGESGGSDVYYEEAEPGPNGLATWSSHVLTEGWYKVEVMLYSSTDIAMSNYIIFNNNAGMSGRLKSSKSILYGVSIGSIACMSVFPNGWQYDSSFQSCRIAHLNFLWKYVSAEGIDWFIASDLIKFSRGSISYTPVNTPTRL